MQLVDFVFNGQAQGPVASALAEARFDPGMYRPYLDQHGHKCITINTGRTQWDPKGNKGAGGYTPVYESVRVKDFRDATGIDLPVFNSTALRKEEWIMLDRRLAMVQRQRLRAWADLSAAANFGGFDGFSKMTLEYEAMSDPGEAVVDMDGLSEGRNDAPVFSLRSVPLAITHSDFWLSSRKLAVSRNTGTPLNLTLGEAAARRVAEQVEKTLIGTVTGLQYGTQSTGITAHTGNSQIYGYTNFPQRQTKTDLTSPTGTNPDDTLADVLEMRDLMYDANFFGPFMLYHSTDWDTYLDNDYGLTSGTSGWGFAPTRTLRNRIREVEGIMDVRRLDFLTDTFTLLLVQMTSEVAEAVNAMAITPIQWETMGGFKLNFKVMSIQVPLLKYDYNNNCGIVHATTS
jgi:hypothetical protein